MQQMKENVKRVFYVRYVAHPCYLDIIAQRPEIRLDYSSLRDFPGPGSSARHERLTFALDAIFNF